MPRSLEEQISRKCVHFNGLTNDTCDAGVNYKDVIDLSKIPAERVPCFREGELVSCAKRQFPSSTEVAARVAEIVASTTKTLKAMLAAKEDARSQGFGKRAGGKGQIKCPCCETGTLHYSVAAYNGHMWAKCTTNECVSWLE